MKIVVTASGRTLDAPMSPVFGRCPVYLFVDPETMSFEAVENPAMNAAGGAGIQAAQFVVERGAQAVVTGNIGPNAFDVLATAEVPAYLFPGGTVREAVNAYRNGDVTRSGTASAPAHAGMGMGRGRGLGMGRGMGAGRRSPTATPPAASQPAQSTPEEPTESGEGARQEEIDQLKEMAAQLRGQLADVMDRLDDLEKREE